MSVVRKKQTIAEFDYPVAIMPCDIAKIPASAPAKVLLALMARRNGKTGQCNPTTKTLAADTGLQERRVERALKELRIAGLVESKVTNKPSAGSDYTLHVTPVKNVGSRKRQLSSKMTGTADKNVGTTVVKNVGQSIRKEVHEEDKAKYFASFARPETRLCTMRDGYLCPIPGCDLSEDECRRAHFPLVKTA